jgi:hypothetical protein
MCGHSHSVARLPGCSVALPFVLVPQRRFAPLQNWPLCLEMVHLAHFSDRAYVCQLWDLALKQVTWVWGNSCYTAIDGLPAYRR